MSCRIIISPVTNKEETSILWNEIRSASISDNQADEIYNQTTSEPFIERFGNWIEEPESIDKSKVNSIGEPKIEYLELPESNKSQVEGFQNKLKDVLLTFIKGLGIEVNTSADDILEEIDLNMFNLEKDVLAAFDVLQKYLAFKEGHLDLLPNQAASIIYTFLGKKSKLSKDLWINIKEWSEYEKYYTEFNKSKQSEITIEDEDSPASDKFNSFAHKQVIIKFIEKGLTGAFGEKVNVDKIENIDIDAGYFEKMGRKNPYKGTSLEKIWAKIFNFFKDTFGKKVFEKYNEDKLKSLVLDIVDDVYKEDYSKFLRSIVEKDGKLYDSKGNELEVKDYNETLKNEPAAKKIIERLVNNPFIEFKLSGSQTLRKYGKLYRAVDEDLHDIDGVITLSTFRKDPYSKEFFRWIIDKGLPLTNLKKHKQFIKEIIPHLEKLNWYINLKQEFPEFKFTNAFIGKDHHNGESITIQGEIPIGDKIYTMDFFLRTDEGNYPEIFDNYWKDWKQIFEAKLNMGRAKDLADLIYFEPFIKDKWKFTNKGFRYFSFAENNSTIIRGPINYYDEPGFKKRNPNFNPETYVNTVNKFGESKKEFPELTPTLNEVKPGVEEIFNNNPELAEIGSVMDYQEYLDSIFPFSKVKDIVYHTNTRGRIESFNSEKGLFVTPTWELAKTYKPGVNGKRFQLIINSKNIDEVSEETIMNGKKQSGDTLMYSEPDYTEYVVFEPEQIHILSSKADIQGFKEFVQGKQFDEGEVSYVLKSLSILQSTKAQELFEKGYKNNWSLDKILTELQIPKEQKQIILDSGKNSREEIITDLLANYSYTIEINTAKEGTNYFTEERTNHKTGETYYPILEEKTNKEITRFGNEEAAAKYLNKIYYNNTQYYSNLTVPGGTNYTENEIATPAITPSIKGHAQFATDNGIGWFRSDEQVINGQVYQQEEDDYGPAILQTYDGESTKTRRILEIQSDLFQKGRDNKRLVGEEDQIGADIDEAIEAIEERVKEGSFTREYADNEIKKLKSEQNSTQNQFLQLLNKNNNWVTFFIKSIIQDSAKKGYEKVLFPTGNTASKIEGHTTLEEFKKQKEDRIKELEDNLINKEIVKETDEGETYFSINTSDLTERQRLQVKGIYSSRDAIEKKLYEYNNPIQVEINQLKQELERVEREGFGALKPIYNFYENTVTNILKKQGYNPILITDEYGNTWNEINIESEYTDNIYLQTENEDLTPSKASPETIERVKEWLSRIGVDIKALDTARYKGINGVADILNNIIEIAEGKTNEALTEEAMHFAVEIMEITNPALYKKMLNKIGNYQIYKNLLADETYVKQFTKQGKLDVIGMKKEAIGKVLAETLIRQEQEGVEKPEFLEQSKSWWQQIVEWFKGLINQAGYNPFEKAIEGLNNIGTVESLKNRQELVKLGKRVEAIQSSETSIFQDEINKALDNKDYRAAISLIANQLTPETFQTVVDRNLNGDTKLGQDIQDFARVYLQTAPENPTADTAMATLKKILADYKVVKHSDTVDPDDESNNSYYTAVINGVEKKTDRTTEWAKRENLKKTGGKDYMKERAKDPILKMQDTVKALKGTELHAYIEAVIKVFLREDGTIMAEDEVDLSLLPAAKSAELKAVETYLLGDTRKGINGFLFQFEAGTKLFTEQMIFNPNVKNQKGELVGRAGTIDLMAFLPNGKVKVYDWKFMGYTPDKLDQAPQKKSQHALQLADYKRTLKETLGIKDIELQTVPFGVIYKMKTVDGKQIPTVKSVVTGNINIREEENTFLLPVVPEDQSTGNKDVDNLVKALKAHYKKLYDKPVGPEGERYIKIQGLNQLSVAIRNLQVALNFKPLVAEAVTFKQNILETIDKYKELDVATFEKEDINKQINELLDLLKSAETYSNLDKAFISVYGEENLDKDAATSLKNLSAASSAARNSKKELTDLLKKYVAHAALQQGFSPTEVLSATKEVQGIINSFLEGTKLPNATMNLFAKIVLEARSNDKRLVAAEIEKFGKIYTELQKAYPSDPFKAIGDGHKLIRKTKKEFWDALRDAYENEDANFILANVDEKKLRDLIADLIEKRFKQIEETVYTTDEKENREQKESHRNRVIKDFDIFRGKGFEGFQNRSFQALVKEAIIEENHYTEEFKKLSGPALDMYNFIFELNRRAFKQGYLGQGNSMRFFPFVLGTTLERLEQSKNILSGAYSSLSDAFTVQKDDTIEYGQIDPETGKLIKTIPKLFTQIGDKEGRENELSTDLLKVIPLYIRALQEYETSKDLEMSFMAMHTVEKAKGHFEVKDNKVIFEGDAPKVFDSNEVNAAALEVMGNDAIYGMRQDTDTLIDTAVSKTTKGTEEEQLRRSMSVKKGIQQANAYTQGLALGLKLLVAIPNFVGVFMQSVVNAGLYYTISDYTRNFKNVVRSTMTGTEGNIMKGLIDLVVPLNEDIVKEGQKKIAWKQSPLKWLSVWSFQDVLMSTNRIGDIAHQLTNAYSFMDNSMVVDGKIVNIRQYIQEKYKGRYKDGSDISQVEKNIEKEVKELKETKSLPKISFFNKDGILEIPGVTEEEISKYRTKIVEFGRNLTGQMSTENKADYRRNILAQSFMMFNNWIPKQVSLRALDIKKDPVLGQWEYGRTRLFAKTIMHVGFTKINKIKDIINATPEGIAIMQEMLEQKREAYYQKTGLELTITEAEFFDMMRKELRAEMKELAILVFVIGLVVAAKVAQPPEEEDDLVKNRYKFWAKAINKISDEMSFYYNPTSAESITRGSVAPSLGLLSKVFKVFYSFGKETAGYVTENEEWQKEAYPQKYFFNIVPFASPFQNEILPIVFPEEAKERGIRTSAEARAMR